MLEFWGILIGTVLTAFLSWLVKQNSDAKRERKFEYEKIMDKIDLLYTKWNAGNLNLTTTTNDVATLKEAAKETKQALADHSRMLQKHDTRIALLEGKQ